MDEILYRKAKEKDLPGITDCIVSVYGENSYYARFYDSHYLNGMLDRIFIAELDGEVVGTLVLSDWGYKGLDRELSTFIVRKGIRSRHVGAELLAYTLDAISHLPSVKGANVTHHTYSQILTERNGYIPTGLLFGVFREKSALVFIVRNYNVHDIGQIFVPEALLPAAEALYRTLGVTFRNAVGAAGNIPDQADIWYDHDAHFQSVEIYILGYGADCADRISEIEAACASPDLTSNVYIDMRSPNAPAAYEALAGADCVYTGFMPLSEAHEYIILHRAAGRPMDYDALKLTTYTEQTLAELGALGGNGQTL
ncbi:MAG: GNAT family N-acetyltransferase [Clostridiales Family XIII bacterium]|jgi:hypothetical protein|nr:GNAT family N-acetyltransferase [Clostridiales Family XIII bacterium]